MVSVIRDVTMKNFLSKGFFNDNQYDFIKGRSTIVKKSSMIGHTNWI